MQTKHKPYALTNGRPPLTLHNMPFTPDGMLFRSDRDYTYCRICGVIYQPELNRVPQDEYTQQIVLAATILRREWSQRHARLHTSTEHRQLAASGRHCTPDAALRLVPMGIIPLTDIVFDDESEHAGLEAPRAPLTDVEV